METLSLSTAAAAAAAASGLGIACYCLRQNSPAASSSSDFAKLRAQLLQQGYCVVPAAIGEEEIQDIARTCHELLDRPENRQFQEDKFTGSLIPLSKHERFAKLIAHRATLGALKQVPSPPPPDPLTVRPPLAQTTSAQFMDSMGAHSSASSSQPAGCPASSSASHREGHRWAGVSGVVGFACVSALLLCSSHGHSATADQDGWYWDEDVAYEQYPVQLFAMYYLTDTKRENGCLRCIPGTHLQEHPLHQILGAAHSTVVRETDHRHDPAHQDAAGAVPSP
jgi:hypothetical protein